MEHIVEEAHLKIACGLASSISEEEAAVLRAVHREAERAVREFIGYDPVYGEKTEYYPLQVPPQFGGRGVWDTTGTHAVFESVDGMDALQLRRLPVRSIAEIRVDSDGRFGQKAGSFGASTVWTVGDQYFLETEEEDISRSGIVYAFSAWPITIGSIKVTYTAGLTRDELNGEGDNSTLDGSGLTAAVTKAAVKAFNAYRQMRKRSNRVGSAGGALTGENLGDYSYTLDAAALARITAMLNNLPPECQQDCEAWRNYGTILA